MTGAQSAEGFLKKFSDWALRQTNIKAVALVGSHARNAATETSDIDLVIITTRPEIYVQDQRWVENFGEVERHQVEDHGLLTSVRAWYADGTEVEYGFTDERWSALPLDEGTRQVISDGMKIIFERGPILSPHQISM
jgi:predicted nucleotidyltransferase